MILGAEVMGMKENHRPVRQQAPDVAPGMTEEALDAEATEEEVHRGDYTEVTKLEPAPRYDRND
ncbi:hypothetical protein [Salinithrix halophila]|uniref:Uncharacterized protein n=1 Tax=Salinithrix halophila TaxID=1485204 RepID=A0ABV8JQQ4_9BACL